MNLVSLNMYFLALDFLFGEKMKVNVCIQSALLSSIVNFRLCFFYFYFFQFFSILDFEYHRHDKLDTRISKRLYAQ